MSEDEATEKLKRLVARCKECKFATCENCEINWNEVQAIDTLLGELEKKDKIIDAMTEWIDDRCFYSDDYGNSCEIIQDSCYDPVKDCKNCIKQYFERKVKDD